MEDKLTMRTLLIPKSKYKNEVKELCNWWDRLMFIDAEINLSRCCLKEINEKLAEHINNKLNT